MSERDINEFLTEAAADPDFQVAFAESDVVNRVGFNVLLRRKALDIPPAVLADTARLSRATVRYLEAGAANLTLRTLARAFVGVNTLAKRVGTYHYHRAAVAAGEPTARAAARIVERHGYRVVPSGAGDLPGTIRAIRIVHKMVAKDEELADRIVGLAARIAHGRQIRVEILRGLFFVASKDPAILNGGYSEKLIEAGQDALCAAIKRKELVAGKGGGNVDGSAILDVANKGKRRRITLGD